MKKIKLNLVLTAAVVFGGFSSVYAAPAASVKDDGAKSAFENLVQLPAAQVELQLPTPAMRAFQDPMQSGGNNTCTPSAALVPGSDIAPRIDDAVRLKAITDLLGKIAACKPLPYPHDGIINTNTEGGMPQAPANFYKEYTLMVPGRNTGDGAVPVVIGGQTYMTGPVLSARGPERIIIGGGTEIYYTMDHYKTFLHLTIVK